MVAQKGFSEKTVTKQKLVLFHKQQRIRMDFKQIRLICLIVFIELCFLGQVILCQNSSTCIYPNVTQSCCNGGDFIFTTPTGPPECYDSSIDLCGNSSLIGDAKIKGSNVTWDNSDESCYCYYDLEICEPEAETLNCITQSVQTCCADQANTDIELTCTDYEDDASNCANTLTYDCASAATQAICSDTDGTTNTPDGYDYFNGNYETVVYWWFDQIDDTLDGKCYCIYEYFSQNELCPSPTAAPTIVGDVETTGGEIDYFAGNVFLCIHNIHFFHCPLRICAFVFLSTRHDDCSVFSFVFFVLVYCS